MIRNIIIAIAMLATVAHGQLLNLGNEPVAVYLGAQELAAVYLGATLIYPSVSIPDADGYLYNLGLHEDMWVEGYTDAGDYGATRSKEADHLYISANVSELAYVTDIMINLTGISSVIVDVGTDNSYEIIIVASTVKDASESTHDAKAVYTGITRTNRTLNVSSLSGEYYVRVHSRDGTHPLNAKSAKFYKVWLE